MPPGTGDPIIDKANKELVAKRKAQCPKCGGEGMVKEVLEMHGMPHIMGVVCDKCNGTSKASKE